MLPPNTWTDQPGVTILANGGEGKFFQEPACTAGPWGLTRDARRPYSLRMSAAMSDTGIEP